jgi:GNAT superfamily N-acetyltransferase
VLDATNASAGARAETCGRARVAVCWDGRVPHAPTFPTLPSDAPVTWRSARAEDGAVLAELRAVVLRPSLERLDRYDDDRVRHRFLSTWAPERTGVLDGPSGAVGSLALRPADDGLWLEHFYLAPDLQGRGLGTRVLRAVTAHADRSGTVLRLDVLRGSDARRLYERHGFVLDHEDPVDVFLRRDPAP